jgi:hypothetical protein
MAPVDINELPLRVPIASSRAYFDALLGVPSALLLRDEIERLRPSANHELNKTWVAPQLLRKVHDAYTYLGDGTPLLGRSPDFSAVYILRDPWDVAVSNHHHFEYSIDEAIEYLCDPNCEIAQSGHGLSDQFTQRLLSWEGHALSWLAAPMQIHLMRYENMRKDPLPTFRGAVRFLGLEYDDDEIVAALDQCRFDRLQRLEQENSFREASNMSSLFFRSGKVGEGLDTLPATALRRMEEMKARVELAIAAKEWPT